MVQIAEDDHDALEVLAFSGSYAGKLEERREIENVEVEDASKISERQEEQKIAEDKRKGINDLVDHHSRLYSQSTVQSRKPRS